MVRGRFQRDGRARRGQAASARTVRVAAHRLHDAAGVEPWALADRLDITPVVAFGREERARLQGAAAFTVSASRVPSARTGGG